MPREGIVFLDDIVQACEKISRYTAGTTLEGFRQEEKTIDAVVRNLEIIGEAAKSLPEDLRSNIVADWKKIAGLRDVLIHAYFGIDADIIWDIVQTKVPDDHASPCNSRVSSASTLSPFSSARQYAAPR